MAEEERELRKKIKCPICEKEIRKPFYHFMQLHPKTELIELICKLLGWELFPQ